METKRFLFIIVLLGICYLNCCIKLTTSQIFPFSDDNDAVRSRIIPKIVGGIRAQRGQFPFQIMIYLHGQKHCGGVILDESNVLTAAHCVMRYGSKVDPTFLKVKAGNIYILSPKILEFDVLLVKVHANFNSSTYKNDVSILKLAQSFPDWNKDLQPVNLATNVVKEGTECTVSGWGSRLLFAPGMPDYLYYTEVKIENHRKCRKLYKLYNKVTSNMICATYEDSPRDSCSGDSGGPLICNKKLSGIVSWGKGCALPKFPGVYVSIPMYLEWIEQTLKEIKNENGTARKRKRPIWI